jgi:hypothetical protein
MKYYEVRVTMTSKPVGSKKPSGDGYRIFDESRNTFASLPEVKAFLAGHYHKGMKRARMFIDDGKHIGYIYCFKNADWSHSPVESWYQQDWVEVREIQSTSMLVR